MLRKIRLTLAVVFFFLITLLFLDFTGTLHRWLSWMAMVQFLPAVLALHFGIVVGLILLTLLFGRVYCSVICPLGVMQDVVSWISGRRGKGRMRRRFQLFSCQVVAQVWRACLVRRGVGCRLWLACRPACPLQFLWQDGPEPFPANIHPCQQRARLHCRACR